jgi:uncharacterized sporulation protein YeaH/YhbH (DUF444 family)
MHEPRFRREGGTRDMVLAGNKKFVEGDYLPRSGEGRGGRPTKPGEGDGEDAFRFVLSRDEFVDLFLDDLELPNLAKRKLAEAESEGLRRFVMTVVTACSMSCWFTSRISWLTSRSPGGGYGVSSSMDPMFRSCR